VKTLADQFADNQGERPNEVTMTLDVPNADLPVILATRRNS